MPLRPGIRRDAPTDLSDVREDPALAARIRDEIRATGPMPFARFMELALYDPDGGYYRSADARPGRGGDFVTAPELHPIFGELLAGAVEDTWQSLGRPDGFLVQEHGAGDGALAVPLPSDPDAPPFPLLVAEPTVAPPPDDAPEVEPYLSALRADEVVGTRLSTIDGVEGFAGLTGVVLVVDDAGEGRFGHYGTLDDAQALLPAPGP